jgi:PAS domain S-box-containing protein
MTKRIEIEVALRESEQRLRWLASIVESSDDAIVSKNLDGIIRSWNSGAERVFGYSASEAIGQPITLVIPQDRHSEEREILTRIRRGERIDHFETIRQHKHGSLIVISLTVSPVKDANGKIVGASKIARDITEQKRSQELIATLHELATNAAKYGALSTPNGQVRLEWSHAADCRLRLRWIETGGRVAQEPTRKGVGSRIIEQMIVQQKGKVRFDWRNDGLVCEISLPV